MENVDGLRCHAKNVCKGFLSQFERTLGLIYVGLLCNYNMNGN
jgi:hypothetical protein